MPDFHPARRVHTSLLAPLEKRCLLWLAARIPAAIHSDHLTALAGLSMLAAGCGYWIGTPAALLAVVGLLGVNWFGDSLDGTLARVRRHERPRYGYYVDHVLDALCILFIFAGLVLGGHMSPLAGAGFLLLYYLVTIEVALATHATGTFRLSFGLVGPTELRILLAAGTLRLIWSDAVMVAGSRWLLFDIGGIVAAAGLAVVFAISAARNTLALYRAEPLPDARRRAAAGVPERVKVDMIPS